MVSLAAGNTREVNWASGTATPACLADGGLVGIGRTSSRAEGIPITTAIRLTSAGEIRGRSPPFAGSSEDAVERHTSVLGIGDLVIIAEALDQSLLSFHWTTRRTERFVLTTERPPRRMSAAEYDSIVRRLIPDQPGAAAHRRRLISVRVSEKWPAYGRVLLGSDSVIWVELRREGGGTSSVWAAVNIAAKTLSYLRVPLRAPAGRYDVLAFGPAIVFIRELDLNGVGRILAFTLQSE